MNEGSSKTPLQLYALVSLVYMLWGVNFIASKLALREIPGLLAAGLRTLLVAAVLYPLYRKSRRHEQRFAKGEIGFLMAMGAIGIGFNQACILTGVQRTSASHAALLIGLTPVFVLLFAAVRGLDRVTGKKVLGLLVAICGVLILQQRHSPSSESSLSGDLLVLCAAASFAIYTVQIKELTRHHSVITIIFYSYFAGALLLLPFTLYLGQAFEFSHLTSRAWLCFGYMTLVSSFFCYLLFYYTLRRLSAARVSAFAYLQPVMATVLAVPVLGEPLTAAILGGGSMVLAGVYLSEQG